MARKLSRREAESIVVRVETPLQDACWSCECMQGLLIQLQLDGDQAAVAFIRALTVPSPSLHNCLGCDPCPPADAYAEYIRGKQSVAEAGCGGCCG